MLSLPPLPGWARLEASTSAQPPVTDGNDSRVPGRRRTRLARSAACGDVRVPFAGVWRRRLALKAAAASARIARRGEDEATLRDAFFLRHGGDDPGPAGRMLVAWRGLDRSAPLADDAVFHVAETLQLKVDDALRAAIADVQQLAGSAQAAPFAAAQAARLVVAQRPDAEILALWLADAVLAARLKWPRPLPLIAGALLHPALRTGGHRPYPGDANWTLSCCVAYGRAAAQACDLFAELGRSSQKLIAVAPRLRARGRRRRHRNPPQRRRRAAVGAPRRHERPRAAAAVRSPGRARRRARAHGTLDVPPLRALDHGTARQTKTRL